MAQTDVKRLLILPAIVLAAALSLTGCANLPFFGGDDNSSNNSSNDKDDDEDDEDEEEEEEEEEASGSSNCPPGFLDSATSTVGGESQVTLISADEFVAPEVGAEYLEDGCFFRVEVDAEGQTSQSDFGYLPGDATTVSEIGANLEAAGFEKLTDGIYSESDTFGVFVYDSGDSMTPEQVDELGLDFGDSFVVVLATKTDG